MTYERRAVTAEERARIEELLKRSFGSLRGLRSEAYKAWLMDDPERNLYPDDPIQIFDKIYLGTIDPLTFGPDRYFVIGEYYEVPGRDCTFYFEVEDD